MNPVISQQLRDLRLAASLSIREVGRQAGVAPNTVSNVETGAHPPSLDAVVRIARVFNHHVILSSKPFRK